jgi:hypothetical protein
MDYLPLLMERPLEIGFTLIFVLVLAMTVAPANLATFPAAAIAL